MSRFICLIVLVCLALSPAAAQTSDPGSPIDPLPGQLYLPLLTRGGVPDLLVEQIALVPARTSFSAGEPVTIRVLIANRGSAPTLPFWVDLYFNPSAAPQLNRPWNTLCGLQPCLGMAWLVDKPLAAGQTLTLTSNADSYSASHSFWPGTLAAGTSDIYVLADSWNPGQDNGASGESDRSNNLLRLRGLRVTP